MILCLNPNAALDRILFIDRFIPKSSMRASREVFSVGGKALVTAVILHALGAPVKALSFVAGRNGRAVEELLHRDDVPTELIWLAGDTRTATVIVETDINRHSHITNRGYEITAEDCYTFFQRAAVLAEQADWAVIGGTLPPGAPSDLHARLTDLLHQHGVRVLIDAFGDPMCAALSARPDIVKLNQDELSETFSVRVDTFDAIPKVCRQIMQRYGLSTMVITCGKDGIVACTPDGSYHAGGPELAAVNAAGAGDAVSAALVYRLSQGDDWTQALSWASAAGAAVVLTPGTGECHLEDVQAIYPRTWVKKLCE